MNNEKKFWQNTWQKHLDEYLKSPPRVGIFIKNYFKDVKSVLEIAGGSCRDSRYLAYNGYEATGSDFDEKTIKYLQKERFPNDKLKYSIEDAFRLSFKDNSFDLVFHNGFFICFNNNEDIFKMLKEQERVSRKYIVIFVHNVKNQKLKKIFKEKSKYDDLYNIRFFDKNEILQIVKDSKIKYKNIKILKFGGLVDIFYKKRIKKIVPNVMYPFSEFLVPKLCQLQKWEHTERICCVVELDK